MKNTHTAVVRCGVIGVTGGATRPSLSASSKDDSEPTFKPSLLICYKK